MLIDRELIILVMRLECVTKRAWAPFVIAWFIFNIYVSETPCNFKKKIQPLTNTLKFYVVENVIHIALY